MIRLFLDIETLPGETETSDINTEEEHRKTALDGNYGRILCIGCIKETPVSEEKRILTGDGDTSREKEILKEFWTLAKDVNQFIGHNVLDFDLKFIWKRSVIHKIKPSINLSFARYRSDFIYDTMQEWEKWRGYIKLDELARIFDIETSKTMLDGSKVYDYYKDGRIEEIYDYCMADVELTRKIYRRMNFREG